MRKNEIKRTVEQVVRVEYIAEDGTVFTSEEECKKYEESALFAVSNKLKRLGSCSQNDFNDCLDEDDVLEIFNVETQEDLDNLRKYLYLKMTQSGVTESDVKRCFEFGANRDDFVFDNVTYGHEVMIFWWYGEDGFWVYGDGSLDGFAEYHRKQLNKIISKEE